MIRVTKIKTDGETMIEILPTKKGVSPLDTVDWDDARAFIGGWAEVVNLSRKAWLMVDEEGLLKRVPLNRKASVLAQRPIVGNAILIESV